MTHEHTAPFCISDFVSPCERRVQNQHKCATHIIRSSSAGGGAYQTALHYCKRPLLDGGGGGIACIHRKASCTEPRCPYRDGSGQIHVPRATPSLHTSSAQKEHLPKLYCKKTLVLSSQACIRGQMKCVDVFKWNRTSLLSSVCMRVKRRYPTGAKASAEWMTVSIESLKHTMMHNHHFCLHSFCSHTHY